MITNKSIQKSTAKTKSWLIKQVYVQNTPEISYYKYFLKKHKIIAIYYIKDNFNPFSEENNINHNQKLQKIK